MAIFLICNNVDCRHNAYIVHNGSLDITFRLTYCCLF